MTAFSTAARLWSVGIMLNALAVTLVSVAELGAEAILVGLIFFVGGFICGGPLIPVFYLLVKFFCSLPYAGTSKIWWIAFMQFVVVLFYYLFSIFLFVRVNPIEEHAFRVVAAAAALAVAASTVLHRRRLLQLYDELPLTKKYV
jgi:hypothetical protein